jgi:hypothetical protein
MPLSAVEEDIARGILVPITIEGSPAARSMPMSAIYRADAPPGEPAVLVRGRQDVRGAGVADETPRNRRLLPVKRAGACTTEVRGSNPLSSTRKAGQSDAFPRVRNY